MVHFTRLHRRDGKVGLRIGGGAPCYSLLFVAEVISGTPADEDGQLTAGDELLAINNESLSGSGRAFAIRLIQQSQDVVTIEFCKWTVEPNRKSLDIMLKSMKHRFVEMISSQKADLFGLRRAVLLRDKLTGELKRLSEHVFFCQELAQRLHGFLVELKGLSALHRELGETFDDIASHQDQTAVRMAFVTFAATQRKIALTGLDCIANNKQSLIYLYTFLTKAIPDVKMTIGKYADLKFEYLSYCLKAKELEDDEDDNLSWREPWDSSFTDWMKEFRTVVHMRQTKKRDFGKLRQAVFCKLAMIESKLAQDLPQHLETFAWSMEEFYQQAERLTREAEDVFPIDMNVKWWPWTERYMAGLSNVGDGETNGLPE